MSYSISTLHWKPLPPETAPLRQTRGHLLPELASNHNPAEHLSLILLIKFHLPCTLSPSHRSKNSLSHTCAIEQPSNWSPCIQSWSCKTISSKKTRIIYINCKLYFPPTPGSLTCSQNHLLRVFHILAVTALASPRYGTSIKVLTDTRSCVSLPPC